MSVTYFLVRVREPVSVSGLTVKDLDFESFLSFGTLEEIKARLLRHKGFQDRSEERERIHQLALQSGFLPAMDLPPGATLSFQGSSREHEVNLHGDPVTIIAINRCAPSEFLPIADSLADLGPFAIWSGSSEELLDPESLRPREPEPSPPIVGEPAPAGSRFDGLLAPRWQVEGTLYSATPPILVDGFIVVPTRGGATILDAGTGSTLWTRTVYQRHMTATPARDSIVLAGDHPQIFGLSLRDGSILWRLPLEGEVVTPGANLSSGHIALASQRAGEQGEVMVLEPTRGAPVWRAAVDAHSTRVAVAASWLLVAGGNHVFCFDMPTGKPMGRCEIAPRNTRQAVVYPAVAEMCGCGGRAIILHTHGLESWAMPALDEFETLMEFDFAEACLGIAASSIVAGGPLPAGGPIVLRVFSPPRFEILHEIEIQGSPATPVDLGGGLCACLVSAPRQDPLRPQPEAEAYILVFEPASGRVLHEEPLGSRRWYPGHLAAGDGRLYVTYSMPDRSGGRFFLRAYDVR